MFDFIQAHRHGLTREPFALIGCSMWSMAAENQL
jgi:hypothetical protein